MSKMGPARWDIEIYEGRNFSADFTFGDGTGTVVDLTGWTAECQVRRRPSENSTLIAEPVVTITDAAAGEFTVTIDDSVTADLEPNDEGEFYFWQLDFTDGTDTAPGVQGRCTVYPSVIH